MEEALRGRQINRHTGRWINRKTERNEANIEHGQKFGQDDRKAAK